MGGIQTRIGKRANLQPFRAIIRLGGLSGPNFCLLIHRALSWLSNGQRNLAAINPLRPKAWLAAKVATSLATIEISLLIIADFLPTPPAALVRFFTSEARL